MSKKSSTKTSTKDIVIQFDPTNMVKLVSVDGMEFIVDKRCISSAKFFKKKLDAEEENIGVDYSAEIVEKIIQYLYYKIRYDHDPDNRPPFDIDPSIALNLMVAAYDLET